MRYSIEETVIAALMSHEPVVIVEGQDDIKFYSNIAMKCECNLSVQAVEMIEGYSEGCDAVINAIEDVQALITADSRLAKSVLGIIDRDARYYMHTIPELNNLLVLKYYSYESHLLTRKSIGKLLGIMTKANRELLTDEAIDFVKRDFENSLNELYYFSLEALKSKCRDDYEACITYGNDPGNILAHGAKEYYWGMIISKKEELDIFADEMGITLNDIRKIAKGKWYLFCWCEYIIQASKTMYTLCGNSLPQCMFCKIGNTDKCLWRKDSTFQIPNIKSILYSEEIIDLTEVQYIIDSMQSLIN